MKLPIAEMLKDKGYGHAIFANGIWAMPNLSYQLPHGFGRNSPVLPILMILWARDFEGKANFRHVKLREKKAFPPYLWFEGKMGKRLVNTKNTWRPIRKLTTIYTEKAVDFIAKNKEETIFFFTVPHSMPHVHCSILIKFKREKRQKIGHLWWFFFWLEFGLVR